MDDFNKKNGGNLIYQKKVIISQYYLVKSVNTLREEYQKKSGEKYDWFMRLRPDVSIEDIPDLTKIKKTTLVLNKYIWEDPNYITLRDKTTSEKIDDLNEAWGKFINEVKLSFKDFIKWIKKSK